MADDRLFVSPDGLNAGALRCGEASASASSGADVLGGITAEFGIFGEFDAARDFHRTAKDLHDRHVEVFAQHAERLTAMSGKAELAARAFAETDLESGEIIARQLPSDG